MKCPGCSGNPSYGCDYPDCQPEIVAQEVRCWFCRSRFLVQTEPPVGSRQPCPSCGVGDGRCIRKPEDTWEYSHNWEHMQ